MNLEQNLYVNCLDDVGTSHGKIEQSLLVNIAHLFEQLTMSPQEVIHYIEDVKVCEMYQQTFFQLLHFLRSDKIFQQFLIELLQYDRALFIHSLHVTIYSLLLAHQAKFETPQLLELAKAALLHDIGKISVSPKVLYKPGKLTDTEFDQIKEHVAYGCSYLKNRTTLSTAILKGIQQHHERLDGSGYPNGATFLHPYAKIIAVADIFDALTAERCCKKSMSVNDAYRILKLDAQTKIEPKYVSILMNYIPSKMEKLISIPI